MNDFDPEYIPLADRVASEVALVRSTLRNLGPAVALFGGARVGKEHASYEHAYTLAKLAAQHGVATISGGGPGIMEAANKGAFDAGGVSIGLNIKLPTEQEPNKHQSISIEFEHFAARKIGFCAFADAYAIFQGGFGTLDELFEVLTLMQTNKISKKPIVLVDTSYWSGMVDWIKKDMLSNKLISPEDLDLFVLADNGHDAWKALAPAFAKKNDPELAP